MYSWEQDLAAYLDVQRIRPGGHVFPEDRFGDDGRPSRVGHGTLPRICPVEGLVFPGFGSRLAEFARECPPRLCIPTSDLLKPPDGPARFFDEDQSEIAGQRLARLFQEEDLEDSITRLALQWKLERTATYRQLQALSNSVLHLTDGRLTLNSFALQSGALTRPVAEGEVRIVRNEGGRLAWLGARAVPSLGHGLARRQAREVRCGAGGLPTQFVRVASSEPIPKRTDHLAQALSEKRIHAFTGTSAKVRPTLGRHVAYLYDRATREAKQMLPSSIEDQPLLVVGLDQGSIGTAGGQPKATRLLFFSACRGQGLATRLV